jgi:hypothetical protein
MARRNTEAQELESMEDVMSLTAESISAPGLLPTGPWTIRNIGFSVSDVTNRDGDEQKLLNLRYEGFEPGPEVDPELVEAGGFEGRTLWVKRYISKPAAKAARDGTLARFVNFVSMHGVDTAGRDLTDMLKALKGTMIGSQIGEREYTNKEGDKIRDNTATDFSSVSE